MEYLLSNGFKTPFTYADSRAVENADQRFGEVNESIDKGFFKKLE